MPGFPNKFVKDLTGSIAPLAALSFTMAAGFAALGVDVGLMYREQVRLQLAADAAVLAAVTALPNETDALALALEYSNKNMPVARDGTVLVAADVEFGQWDAETRIFTAGVSPASVVRVTTRLAQANGNAANWHLARIFGFTTADISRVAVALKSSLPCLLALDPSARHTLSLDSNAEITAPDCEVYSDSSSGYGLSAYSNSHITSQKTCTVGHYVGSGSHYRPTPEQHCPFIADPLASLSPPSFVGCNHNNFMLDTSFLETINPGVYCGGILIKNNTKVTFNPGIYIIKNGEFKVDSNAEVNGTGVGFYLTGDAKIYFDSNTKVDFTAPTDGDMAGLIFFEDRSATLLIDHEFNSNSINRLEGAIYLSRGYLRIDSNSNISQNANFTTIIARRIKIDSNANLILNADYDASSVPSFFVGANMVNLLL